MKFILTFIASIAGLTSNGFTGKLTAATIDSVRVEKINKRIGRTVCQCFYWKENVKIDSVGIEPGIDTCIPFAVILKIEVEYYKEYGAKPTLTNFSVVQSSVRMNNAGLEVGLYEFYLGYTSHPTLYKVLVFEDKVIVRLKRVEESIQSFKILLREFEKKYSKIFSKAEMKDIKSTFLEGVIDL